MFYVCLRTSAGLQTAQSEHHRLSNDKRFNQLARATMNGHRPLMWIGIAVAWAATSAVGLFMLMDYSSKPGHPADAPKTWPANDQIPLAKDRDTLVFFAHPKCPCTSASFGELEKLVARCPDAAKLWIV